MGKDFVAWDLDAESKVMWKIIVNICQDAWKNFSILLRINCLYNNINLISRIK